MELSILVRGFGHITVALGIVDDMILVPGRGFSMAFWISDWMWLDKLFRISVCIGGHSVPISLVWIEVLSLFWDVVVSVLVT